MEFREIGGGIRSITISPDDWCQMDVRSTSSNEYSFAYRNHNVGDVVITSDGICVYDENGLLTRYESLPKSSLYDERCTRTIRGASATQRVNFAERIRKVFEMTMESDKELYDEHGGTLDEFLSEFSERKQQV